MKIGDIVEYTDHHGTKHDAKITRVVKQSTNIEGTQHTEIINVEYNAGGRVRIAELVSKTPNASGQCYGKVLKSTDWDNSGGESTEDEGPRTAEDNEDGEYDNTTEADDDQGNDKEPEASSEDKEEAKADDESEPSEKS